jgi:hypothetical protein
MSEVAAQVNPALDINTIDKTKLYNVQRTEEGYVGLYRVFRKDIMVYRVFLTMRNQVVNCILERTN